jgi:putative serine/threonine protein kinase
VQVLCYPSPDSGEAERRIEEMSQLGVSRVIFEGHTRLGSLGLLGKGCVSVVVKAEVDGRFYALKIRRLDANRPSMRREAELHRMANGADVGPSLLRASDNFLLMEIVEGESLVSWARLLKGVGATARLRAVVRDVLEQCFRLDQLGLDHGELSNLRKHVFVGRTVVILDFETASLNRRVANVTSALQNMLVGGAGARKVRRMLRLMDVEKIIGSVRRYKADPDRVRFEVMLRELRLL